MEIYCCACKTEIKARLTNGLEIYEHRKDLHGLPFWICDDCKNFVGCHHKTKNRTRPLGCIATQEIKNARKEIHKILDPLWKSKKFNRKYIYGEISKKICKEYHTAEIKSIDEARQVYKIVKGMCSDIEAKAERKRISINCLDRFL